MESQSALPDGYTARPATLDDLTPVTETINAAWRAEMGAPLNTEQEVLDSWRTPGWNIATDSRVVLAPDGSVAGYGELWNLGELHIRAFIWARVHPDHYGRGIGTAMLEWAERRAREQLPLAPDDARVVLVSSAYTHNPPALALCRDFGFEDVRHFYRMVIEQDAPPPAPVWPEGVTVRTYRPGEDDRAIFNTVEDVFHDHWDYSPMPFERWMHMMTEEAAFDPSLWFLAMAGDEIVGFSLCRPHLTEDPEMGWVSELGVHRDWRRQGIALALLHHTFGVFYGRGTRKVGLGVDSDSLTGATRVYERAGMAPVQESIAFHKELRPGREYGDLVAPEETAAEAAGSD